MRGMEWRKSSPELVALFESLCPGPPAEKRQMFGYPAGFVGGNMFAGLHQENMVLRLSDDDRTRFLTLAGAAVFEPMPGKPMKQYVIVPAALLHDVGSLRPWIARALSYGASLPPKAKKPVKRKAAAKKKVAAAKKPAKKKPAAKKKTAAKKKAAPKKKKRR
jgi:TfoX/Sxy family transcriptional regulator of competence genes